MHFWSSIDAKAYEKNGFVTKAGHQSVDVFQPKSAHKMLKRSV